MKKQVDIENENIQMMLTRGMNDLINSKESESLGDTKIAGFALPYYIGDLANSLVIYSDTILMGKAKIKALPAKMLQLLDPLVVAHYTTMGIVNSRNRELSKIANQIAQQLETEYKLSLLKDKDDTVYKNLVGFIQGTSYTGKRKFKLTNDLLGKFHQDIAKSRTSFKKLALKAIVLLASTRPIIDGEITPPLCYLEQKGTTYKKVVLAKWFHEWLMEMTLKNDGALLAEYHTPLIERPIPWTGIKGGGFHTPRFKYNLIRSMVSLDEYIGVDMNRTLKAVNRLQDTKWRINKDILEVMSACIENQLGWGDLPKPYVAKDFITPCPHNETDNAFLTEEQKADRKVWRSQAAPHYAKEEAQKSKVLMAMSAIREAKRFKDYNELYFAYFLDFRGRAYPKANALSPQGTDFIKALLQFSEGKLITDETLQYFCMHGANTFGNGLEKKTLSEKVLWVMDNTHRIVKCAENPYDLGSLWHEADEEPWLFLAFCFEFAEYIKNPKSFKSRLAVAMDGSCNGLQHLSAMLNDEVGGSSVNLTAKPVKGDIYADVKDEAIKLLEAMSDPLADALLDFGVTRKICKRPVMIVPYAGTKNACRKYIDAELLDKDALNVFGERYKEALTLLTDVIWEAIGNRILKGKEIMSYLSSVAKILVKDGETKIYWETPNGFRVIQERLKHKDVTIKTPMGNNIRERGYIETKERIATDKTDSRAHSTGIAPNFVHSLDACHLQETVNEMSEGCSFAMIHDSFGVHAADSKELHDTLRKVFVDMYVNKDPLGKFIIMQDKEIDVELPSKGTLDLNKVLEDEFFFS